MQNQLPAAHAALGQKTFHFDGLTYRESGDLVGRLGKCQRIDLALHLPCTVRFGLLRAVTYRQFHSRHPGRGVPQTIQCDQLSADDNLVTRQ